MSEQTTAPTLPASIDDAMDAAGGDPVNLMVHRHGEAYYALVEGRTGHLGRGSTAEDAIADLRDSLARSES